MQNGVLIALVAVLPFVSTETLRKRGSFVSTIFDRKRAGIFAHFCTFYWFFAEFFYLPSSTEKGEKFVTNFAWH